MSDFSFTIPGQPPSVNHLYKIATSTATDKFGQTVYGSDGKPKRYRRMVKAEGVEAYQTAVGRIVQTARPRGWQPGNRVRLRYWFHLKRDMDCDNALKALNDAIARALGVNDKIFLPCVQEKTTGNKEPSVRVEIECA